MEEATVRSRLGYVEGKIQMGVVKSGTGGVCTHTPHVHHQVG